MCSAIKFLAILLLMIYISLGFFIGMDRIVKLSGRMDTLELELREWYKQNGD